MTMVRVAASALTLIVIAGLALIHAGQLPSRDTRAPAPPAASAPSPDPARISGTVVAAPSGAAVRNALVRITPVLRSPVGGPPENEIVWTDEEGRYEANLDPGRYTLFAEKTGYVSLQYGQRRPREAGRVVELQAGQSVDNVNFAMPKAGVIVARVLDEVGEPIKGVAVTVLEYRFLNGERRLSAVNGRTPSGVTDDRGLLRVAGLAPGEYYARSSPRGRGVPPLADGRKYQETYHPSTPYDAEAQPVILSLGEERAIDITLTAASNPIRIMGNVRSFDGSPPSESLLSVDGVQVALRPDGTFETGDLPYAKEHSILVRPNRIDRPDGEYASLRVDGRTGNQVVSITTSRPETIRGRFVFDDGPAPQFRSGALQVSVTGTGTIVPLLSESSWNSDWSFEITRLQGNYLFRLMPGSEWVLKAVRTNGRDITDVPIEVGRGAATGPIELVVTQRRAVVTGRVVDRSDAGVSEYVAVVFPEDRARWNPQSRFIAEVRPDLNGVFRVSSLPPGRYRVAAVTYLEMGQARSTALLERLLAGSATVDLVEGQSTEITLRLSDY